MANKPRKQRKTKPPAKASSSTKTRYYFDEAAADRACMFIEGFCTHSKGEWAGKPFIMDPWQRKIVRDVFGTKTLDGRRRYRKVYVEIPRKNGKSTFAAAVGTYLLFGSQEPGAEIYSAAMDKQQAKVVFGEARRMVQGSADLREFSEVYTNAIVVPTTASSWQPLSRDAKTKHGLNIYATLFDELHTQDDRELFDVLDTASGARREPLMLMFTTAGQERTTLCWEMHEHAQRILRGEVQDDSFYPVIYAADEGDDWTKPETWRKANPALGTALRESELAEACRQAMLMPGAEAAFKQLRLNLWVQAASRAINMQRWDLAPAAIAASKLAGKDCWIGLDLATRSDFTAAVAMFPEQADGTFPILCRFWIPEAKIREKERSDKIPLKQWIKRGLVEATPGDITDYEHVRKCILEWKKTFSVREVAIDPYNSSQFELLLGDDGLEVFHFEQAMKHMNEPTKKMYELYLNKKLRHGGNPVLRWMASNAVEYRDANSNVKLIKNRSAGRIDGMIALIMAVARTTLGENARSAYEQEGLVVIS